MDNLCHISDILKGENKALMNCSLNSIEQSACRFWGSHSGGHEEYHSACHLLSRWFLTELIFTTLKMEAICFSETSVGTQRTTWCYIREDGTLHNHQLVRILFPPRATAGRTACETVTSPRAVTTDDQAGPSLLRSQMFSFRMSTCDNRAGWRTPASASLSAPPY
jgi:hypothetical protein